MGARPYSKNYATMLFPGHEYTEEQIMFLKAISNFKQSRQKPFLTWAEVLDVAKSLGYRKVVEEVDLPALESLHYKQRC